MIDIIKKLRDRIAQYRKNEIEDRFNEFELTSCTTIELAVIYAELYYTIGRKISSSEMVYFNGGRFISDIIGSEKEYKDIYDMYRELSTEINKALT